MTSIVLVAAADGNRTPYDVEVAPWPRWRGPYGNGTAVETGLSLVDDLSTARLVWTSDALLPASYSSAGGIDHYWLGGYSSPIVAEDRVYVAYWAPPGRTSYEYTEEDRQHAIKNRLPRSPTRDADNIVHAFDAHTGKTVWKRTFPKDGAMLHYFHGTCCYWDGHILAPGSNNRLYCLKANSGELVWRTVLPGATDQDKLASTSYTDDKGRTMKWAGMNENNPVDPYHSVPAVAEGVVVQQTKDRSFGLDLSTGKILWENQGGPNYSSPSLWIHGTKTYVIVGLQVIEPRSGKVLYVIDHVEGIGIGSAVSVVGDHVVVPYAKPTGNPKGYGWGPCLYRLSPDGCTKVWEAPIHLGAQGQIECTLAYRGHLYYRMAHVPGGTIQNHEKDRIGGRVDLVTGQQAQPVVPVGTGWNPAYNAIGMEGRVLVGETSTTMNYAATDAEGWRQLPSQLPAAARRIGGMCNSVGPAYAHGFIFYRTQSNDPDCKGTPMVCLDLRAR